MSHERSSRNGFREESFREMLATDCRYVVEERNEENREMRMHIQVG